MRRAGIVLALVCGMVLTACTESVPPQTSSDPDATATSVTTTTSAVTTATVSAPAFRDEGDCKRVTGDWRRWLTPVTEKAEQVDGYALLKNLRHKEKEYGYTFSAEMEGQVTVQGQEYYLCEIGHWVTTDTGSTYDFVQWLMVPTDLSAAYVAQVGKELSWDTSDNWVK